MRALVIAIVLALSAGVAHADAQISATPSSLDFGNVPQGQTKQLTFVLANGGDATTTITSTSFRSNAGFSISNLPTSLPPGAHVTVTVTFAPAPGMDGGFVTLLITSTADITQYVVTISGDDNPLLLTCPVCTRLTPNAVAAEYGMVGWQATVSQPFTLSNSSDSDITVDKLVSSNDEFAIIGAPAAPFTVPAHGDVAFSVATVPGTSMFTDAEGSVDVFTGLTPGVYTLDCELQAEEVSGELVVTPGTLVDFGGVDLRAKTPATKTITLQNVGGAPLSITDWPTLTGPFTSPAVGPVTIPAGGSQSVVVTYQPSTEQSAQTPDSTTLVVQVDGLIGKTQPFAETITLTGHGTDRHLHLTGAPIDFPDTFAGSNGAAVPVATVTLSNSGEAPVDVSALQLDGDPMFELVETAPLTVAGGQSTDLHVRFAPSAIGSFTGTLAIMHDDQGTTPPGMSEVALSGSGVSRVIGVSPTGPIDLGSVRIDDAANQLITITNLDATRSTTVTDVECRDAQVTSQPSFLTFLQPPTTLAPGQSLVFDVGFAPTEVGPLSGSFLVYFDGDNQPDVVVPLTGTGLPARNTYYACAATNGGRDGGLVIVLAIGLVAARRRRRTPASPRVTVPIPRRSRVTLPSTP